MYIIHLASRPLGESCVVGGSHSETISPTPVTGQTERPRPKATLYIHNGGELQQGALWSYSAALGMQLLQVLQETSLLQTLQDHCVVGGQTHVGPAEQNTHIFLVDILPALQTLLCM